MEKKVLKVNGMSCNHCKMSIEKALKGIGVDAAVNLGEKTVTVEYDPAKVKFEQIVTEIEDQGYDVVQ
ncbi:MAG: copper ion binding protein [Peptococcaceae bacterium]|jgi:copper chaperone|uniref:Copper chaperone n=1 Tax=Thermanaerosceptrum fracticalcis TaxID=1712410 RepID=A0A7G6E3V3_THEFR|nr:cation transporter [Thermanaerosceptrum fracticalcis]MBZ4654064.1 copper ion binding protein [Peptococcaceae bacterium]QNB46757.1 copper chaperone [Thermanaerosceptrum fracticalcis]